MKIIDQEGGAENSPEDLLKPQLRSGEVLVKILAAVSETTTSQGSPATGIPNRAANFSSVNRMSCGFSGVVACLGQHVKGLKVGDAVFGVTERSNGGTPSKDAILPATPLAYKPRLLDHNQAARVPLPSLTAWRGLLEKARLQSHQRVLIHGADGQLGIFAVQLARWRGAQVIATAAAKNQNFVGLLGADEVIDSGTARLDEVIRPVDVVFDTTSGETTAGSWRVLKPGGSLVTVRIPRTTAAAISVPAAFLVVRPDGSQLVQIANLIDAGDLRVSEPPQSELLPSFQ